MRRELKGGYAGRDEVRKIGAVLLCIQSECDPGGFQTYVEPVVRRILAEGIHGENAFNELMGSAILEYCISKCKCRSIRWAPGREGGRE